MISRLRFPAPQFPSFLNAPESLCLVQYPLYKRRLYVEYKKAQVNGPRRDLILLVTSATSRPQSI